MPALAETEERCQERRQVALSQMTSAASEGSETEFELHVARQIARDTKRHTRGTQMAGLRLVLHVVHDATVALMAAGVDTQAVAAATRLRCSPAASRDIQSIPLSFRPKPRWRSTAMSPQ